jgi:DMSO reductase family type II enzyme chaperone
MTNATPQPPPGLTTHAAERTVAEHATRSLAYRALSALVTSPSQEAWSTAGVRGALAELQQAATLLPFGFESTKLASVVATLDDNCVAAAARDYGSQFEVGERGPPLAIRAELAPHANPTLKEELARFYEHFGYQVAEQDAWQLDHLAVVLEFLHYLAYCAVQADSADDVQSAALASKDVLARHVLPWLPAMVDHLARSDAAPLLGAIFTTVYEFVAADHAWLAATLD